MFLAAENEIVLGDLGLPIAALGMDMRRMSYDFRYAAPEHFQSEANIGPASDFYSLGCLVFQLIYGVPPYVAETPYDLIRAHLIATVTPPEKLPNPFGGAGIALLTRLLSPDPIARPSGDDILLHIAEIETRLHSKPVRVPGETSDRKPNDWKRFAPVHSIVSMEGAGQLLNETPLPHSEEQIPSGPSPQVVPHESVPSPSEEGAGQLWNLTAPPHGVEQDSVSPPTEDLPQDDSIPPFEASLEEQPHENSADSIAMTPIAKFSIVPRKTGKTGTVYSSLSHLRDMGLLTEEDLHVCESAIDRNTSIDNLVELLVNRGRLTKYQGSVICNRRTGWLKIGDYIILDMLGKGGMGVVYRAYDTRMHREVAIKMLLESGQQSEEKIERFRREAISTARLNHPSIVTAYYASEHEGYPYLVMEYVKGRDLGSIVKKGEKLSMHEAVNYILQASVGLAYAHKQNIIHRDMKPSNLMLTAPDDIELQPSPLGRIKILDLGLARLTHPNGEVISPALEGSDLSVTGMLMGTVDYMAPEQAMDTKRSDHRSDIYSLGCTLYYLLTKHRFTRGATSSNEFPRTSNPPFPF